jgi:arylsulfatase A-like enzyme
MGPLLTALWSTVAPAAEPPDRPHIVLVSMDTTRADALSCYGAPDVPFSDATPDVPRTPVLDQIARDGVRFERFYAHAPSTLTSHTSMFSGRDPHGHGVVRNGYPVEPHVPLLAEQLSGAGYATRAIIAAAALEAAAGLERGFDVYDDESPELQGLMYQAPADAVVDRAFEAVDAWTATEADEPLFLFVHFFDAHTPYSPPEPYASRFAPPGYDGRYLNADTPLKPLVKSLRANTAHEGALAAVNGRYLAEVAWMDAQIGRLVDGLEARGVLANDALLVLVGDHGEVLSEDPVFAWTHGNNVSDGVLRVPLLFKAYGDVPIASERVVGAQASMDQLAPTLARLAGLPPDPGVLGTHDLLPLLRPGPVDPGLLTNAPWPESPVRTVFMEATRPRNLEHPRTWNNIRLKRAVLAGGYRMDADPAHGERPHLPDDQPAPLLPILVDLMAQWDADVPPHRDADMPEYTRRALEALGYIDPE